MKTLRPFIPSLAAMLLASGGTASAQSVLIEKSEICFSSKQKRNTIDGKFRKWRANVDFRPKQLAKSKAEFEIELASIDLASEELENEIKRPVWFDTEQFPVARFTSTAMKGLGADRYEIRGELSLKGITRDVVVPGCVTEGCRRQQRCRGPVHAQSFRLPARRRPVDRW
jgi:polyisoprenoid-binding protein YceI